MMTTVLATVERRNPGSREGADDQQYLTFHLDGEHYGLDILKVQEIRDWAPVTVISNMPAALRGILNLRGNLVPIIDLRAWFGLTRSDCNKGKVVIVTRPQGENSERTIGMVVDGIPEVLKVPTSAIRPAPDLSGAVGTAFISGLIAIETGMTRLLDVDRLSGMVEQFTIQMFGPDALIQGVACPLTPRFLGD
jgi:purine-binding chemotaxis protein CheW